MTRLAVAVGLVLAVARGAAAGAEPPWRQALDGLGLPLTVVDATGEAHAFYVLMTGDGGWAEVDKAVAAGLAQHGITTIAWSSLRYFVTTQSPAKVAADLGRLVDALAPAHLPVYAGGYSFGAEVVPVVVAQRWSAAERARLKGLLLLAPSASASFRISPLDWVREPPPDPKHRVDDAVRRLAPLPVLCVTGRDDATCVCGTLDGIPGVTVARVPGTHHFENGIPDLIDAATSRLFTQTREAP